MGNISVCWTTMLCSNERISVAQRKCIRTRDPIKSRSNNNESEKGRLKMSILSLCWNLNWFEHWIRSVFKIKFKCHSSCGIEERMLLCFHRKMKMFAYDSKKSDEHLFIHNIISFPTPSQCAYHSHTHFHSFRLCAHFRATHHFYFYFYYPTFWLQKWKLTQFMLTFKWSVC